jgi:hypothetical protein
VTKFDDDEEDKPLAVLMYGDAGYDGAGWYYWDEEYPDEGSVGAFATREEAVAHAQTEGGYRVAPETPTKPSAGKRGGKGRR